MLAEYEEGKKMRVIMIENHGDLIDRDAFMKRMDRKIYRITVSTPDQEVILHKDVTYAEMFDCIMEEPVVVPSDKTIITSKGTEVKHGRLFDHDVVLKAVDDFQKKHKRAIRPEEFWRMLDRDIPCFMEASR